MSKRHQGMEAMSFAGTDVSAATLAAAVQQQGREGFRQQQFTNSPSGHKQLIAWLLKCDGAKLLPQIKTS